MTKRLLIILSVFVSLCVNAQTNKSRGVPANPQAKEIILSDGTMIILKLKGDAVIHWYETLDGAKVLKNEDGDYSYAVLDSNGNMKASQSLVGAPNRTNGVLVQRPQNNDVFYSQEQIKDKENSYFGDKNNSKMNLISTPSKVKKAFITKGSFRGLMILAEFSDKPHIIEPSRFEDIMNEENYNNTGSFRDYYLENSYNQFDFTTDIVKNGTTYVWVTLPNSMAYYGANDSNGNDIRPREMVVDACRAADDLGIDFSDYDSNDDGYVDNVMIVHSGYGEENANADPNWIWSHRWSVRSMLYLDGVSLADYATFPEFSGASGNSMTNLGVLAHEFGHVLGLPDFYDTDYSGSGGQAYGLGNWDIMSGGSWNNNGITPAQHNAFSKSLLDWIDIPLLQSAESSSEAGFGLFDITDIKEGSAFKIKTNTENEFFIIENRQQRLFNLNIPFHGMLIYHVDRTNMSIWDNNLVNNDPSHEYMKLLMAGGNENDELSMPFPGNNNVSLINDSTIPNFQTWSGEHTDVELSSITEYNGVISFYYNSSLVLDLNFEYGDDYNTYVDFSSDKVLLSNSITGVSDLYSLNQNGVCLISESYRGVGFKIEYLPSSARKEVSITSKNASESASKKVYLPIQTIYNASIGAGDSEIVIPLKLSSIDEERDFIVYPNPCKDEIHIELTMMHDALLQVIDMSGRVVIEKRLASGILDNNVLHLLNLSELQSGIYNIVISNSDNRLYKRIIKM